MQTFLPYPDFYKSAQALDNKRLGKQRVEVLQILNALTGKSKGWRNHPAVRMWKGYERELVSYGDVICSEWRKRGFKDTVRRKILDIDIELAEQGRGFDSPPWLGNPDFHLAHRAALKAKDPEHYHFNATGWTEEPKIDYIWPV